MSRPPGMGITIYRSVKLIYSSHLQQFTESTLKSLKLLPIKENCYRDHEDGCQTLQAITKKRLLPALGSHVEVHQNR